MGGLNRKRQPISTHHLPYDIIENILSRLPVESLLRFKTVCKSWNATISDPGFAAIHVQQSRNSSNQNILFWFDSDNHGNCNLVKFENQKFLESEIKFSLEEQLDPTVLCYCDGLALRRYPTLKDKMYVLCNPCSGTYIQFCCPYRIYHDSKTTAYGICYDPWIKDYKVVILDKKQYVVYHCRNKYWTEKREMKEFSSDQVIRGKGVSFDGDLYWILKTKRPHGKEVRGCKFLYEIVCFDSRDEKFNKLPKPNYRKEVQESLYLTCFGGHMYLFKQGYCEMIKVGGHGKEAWMEFNGEPRFWSWSVVVVCLINKNEVMVKVPDSTTTMGCRRIPYLENLFFSSQKGQLISTKAVRNGRWTPVKYM